MLSWGFGGGNLPWGFNKWSWFWREMIWAGFCRFSSLPGWFVVRLLLLCRFFCCSPGLKLLQERSYGNSYVVPCSCTTMAHIELYRHEYNNFTSSKIVNQQKSTGWWTAPVLPKLNERSWWKVSKPGNNKKNRNSNEKPNSKLTGEAWKSTKKTAQIIFLQNQLHLLKPHGSKRFVNRRLLSIPDNMFQLFCPFL